MEKSNKFIFRIIKNNSKKSIENKNIFNKLILWFKY